MFRLFYCIILILFLQALAYGQVSQASGPVQLNPFASKEGFYYAPDAVECVAAKSTDGNYKETTCDYVVKWNCKINGIKPILKGHHWGDYSYMTVHHPANQAVLGTFGEKVMFDDSVQNQDWIEAPYDADLFTGLIVRIHYFTKNQTNDVGVIFNLRLHRIIP